MVVLASQLLEHFCLHELVLGESTFNMADFTILGLNLACVVAQLNGFIFGDLFLPFLGVVCVVMVGASGSILFELLEMPVVGTGPVVGELD